MNKRFMPTFSSPNPLLHPLDVVKIQLDALQNNDLTPDDAGIRAAYEYASPANRAVFGSLEQFIRMVKDPSYRMLIGFERAELMQIIINGLTACQRITVIGNAHEADYFFILSCQAQSPYADCWMTDAVLLHEVR